MRGRWKWCIQASAGRTVAVVEDRNTSLERAIGGRKRVSRIALGSRVDDEPSTCSVVIGARSNVTPLAVAIVSVGYPRLCVRPARHTHHRPIVASKELPWSKRQGAGCQGWRRWRQWWRSRRSGTLGTERALARAPAALRGPVLGVSGAEGLTRPARSIDRSWHERWWAWWHDSSIVQAVTQRSPICSDRQRAVENRSLARSSSNRHTTQARQHLFCCVIPPTLDEASPTRASSGSTRGESLIRPRRRAIGARVVTSWREECNATSTCVLDAEQ